MTQNEAKVQIQGQAVSMLGLILAAAAQAPLGTYPPYDPKDAKWQALTANIYQGVKVCNNGLAGAFSDHGAQGAADGWPDPTMLPDAANPSGGGAGAIPGAIQDAVNAVAPGAGSVVAPVVAAVAHALTPGS